MFDHIENRNMYHEHRNTQVCYVVYIIPLHLSKLLVRRFACICIYIYICIHTHTHTHQMHTHTHTNICIYTTRIHTHTHTHIHIYIYICIYSSIYLSASNRNDLASKTLRSGVSLQGATSKRDTKLRETSIHLFVSARHF